ncbi:MAG: DUF1015 domain-containing protein [Planctomycetota bacterium]|jgi:uncharacterized protein (DUF1015 family)
MEIRPFKAYRYDTAVVGDVGDCIAPPYDVIGADQQEALYAQSDYNIVRIIKGKTTDSDDGQTNQYTRAADHLTQWIHEGALKEDAKEAIYAYVQDFEIAGQAFQRLTFIALAKLEDFGKAVKPHEQIFEKPMLDRLNLKKATAARFGLVFMMYEDPLEIADKIIRRTAAEEPLIDFVDEQDVRHRLYAVGSDEDIDAIAKMMADKTCIIADGHHRYTTGLNYARQTDNPAAKYQMLAFTNLRQKGLVVLATHRVIGHLESFEPTALLEGLRRQFEIIEFPIDGAKEQAKKDMLAKMSALHDEHEVTFGVYMAGDAFYVARLKDKQVMAAAAPEMSEAWRTLDVSVLKRFVLQELLDIDKGKKGDLNHLEYVKDRPNAINETIARVDAGQMQIAFFTNPVKMQQLVDITEAGERMPQKSTYFYPKMYTGLTIQKL